MALDVKRRELIYKTEQMKSKQNADSKLITQYKKEGKDVAALMEEMKVLSSEVTELDQQIKEVDDQITALLMTMPNIPNESVPAGDSDADNQEIRKWGTPVKFDFEPKAHWDIGEALDIRPDLSYDASYGAPECYRIKVLTKQQAYSRI